MAITIKNQNRLFPFINLKSENKKKVIKKTLYYFSDKLWIIKLIQFLRKRNNN
jgi:Mn-containing catalase